MDNEDRLMLRFMLTWAPYGGPPEDETFVAFGINTDELRKRCVATIQRETITPRCLPASDVKLLVSARTRICPPVDLSTNRQEPQGAELVSMTHASKFACVSPSTHQQKGIRSDYLASGFQTRRDRNPGGSNRL